MLIRSLFIMLVFSCSYTNNSNENRIAVKYVTFGVEQSSDINHKSDTFSCILNRSQENENYLFDYECSKQIDYHLIFDNDEAHCEILDKDEISNLKAIAKKTFNISGKEYRVYKFIDNIEKIDGLTALFFCKDFGLLMRYSKTWRKGNKLSLYDNSNEPEFLSSQIINDISFLKRDGLFPPPPFPNSFD